MLNYWWEDSTLLKKQCCFWRTLVLWWLLGIRQGLKWHRPWWQCGSKCHQSKYCPGCYQCTQCGFGRNCRNYMCALRWDEEEMSFAVGCSRVQSLGLGGAGGWLVIGDCSNTKHCQALRATHCIIGDKQNTSDGKTLLYSSSRGAGWARLLKEARGRRGTTAGIKDTLPQYREMLGFARLCMRQKGRSQVQAVEVGEDRSHGRWTKNLCDFPLGRKWEGGLNPLTSLTHFNHTIPNHNLTTQDFGAILCKVLPLSWLPAGCGGGRPGNGEAGLGPEYDDGRLTFRWSWGCYSLHWSIFWAFLQEWQWSTKYQFYIGPWFLKLFLLLYFLSSVGW